MTTYPSNIYPIAPKPEWFMDASTNLHSVSVGQGATADLPDTHYTKLGSAGYSAYLVSHNNWRDQIHVIESEEHDRALRRRALENHREVATVRESATPYTRSLEIPGYENSGKKEASVLLTLEKKKQHKPNVSTKPHKAEKRQAKVNLTNAIEKEKAQALQQKAASVPSQAADKKVVAEQVRKLKNLRPLHAEENVAAKSAAARVKNINFGSTDLVANVDPQDGWKVTTRKKGDYWPQFVRVDTAADHTSIRMDPVAGDVGRITTALMRKPTTTGSR